MIRKKFNLSSVLLTIIFLSTAVSVLSEAYAFNANKEFLKRCSSCHTVGKGDKIGPDLKDVTKRRSREWIYKFVPSPQAMLDAGDSVVTELKDKYKELMPDQELAKDEIEAILKLIEGGGPVEIASAVFVPKSKPAHPLVKKYFFVVVLVTLLILTLWSLLTRRTNFLIVNLVLIGSGTVVGTIWEFRKLGLTEGYAPKQPINYSHKVHAGINQIQCKYCHFAASKGRHAGIPPVEMCLNCHDHIKTKIVKKASEGSPEVRADSDEIATIRKAVKENRPIKWVKVHMLPDHVYFNHSQHVEVAKLKCQACHGTVEALDIMKQEYPISMGWCIDCHRRNEIAPPDGHKSQAGGDCSKCHY